MTTLWHPNAKRVPIASAPQDLTFRGGGEKVIWHTTEGTTVEGAIAAYKASGVCPHFTIGMRNGQRVLVQHLPLNRAASALRHAQGPETNRANAWQVEIVGFASASGQWSDRTYHYLNLLARYLNRHCNVPMTSKVIWRDPKRLSPAGFVLYRGHCGHVHVPGNDHYDPGTGFHIHKVLNPKK